MCRFAIALQALGNAPLPALLGQKETSFSGHASDVVGRARGGAADHHGLLRAWAQPLHASLAEDFGAAVGTLTVIGPDGTSVLPALEMHVKQWLTK